MDVEIYVSPEFGDAYASRGDEVGKLIRPALAKDRSHGELLQELVAKGHDEDFAKWCISFFGEFGPGARPKFGITEAEKERFGAMAQSEVSVARKETAKGCATFLFAFLCRRTERAANQAADGLLAVDTARRRIKTARMMSAEAEMQPVPEFDPAQHGYVQWQIGPAQKR